MSNYFTISELCHSDIANARLIVNRPSPQAVDMMERLIDEVLNPLRDEFCSPIKVNSGYRSEALNKAVNGSKTSAHLIGAAADIKAINGKNRELFELAKDMIEDGVIEVSQLIWEYGDEDEPQWIHIACTYPGSKHNEILYLR